MSLTTILLVGAAVLLVAVLAVRVSTRFGLPTLLLYLAIGVGLGESGVGIRFDDASVARDLGSLALVVILAEGGLTTRWSEVRPRFVLGVLLSTVGVAVSVVVMATFMVLAFDLAWQTALVVGAVVSSTDAAAVFSVLRSLGLPHRVSAAMELESGMNDAPVIILVTLLSVPGNLTAPPWEIALLTAYELVGGGVIGVAVGRLAVEILRRSALPVAGLYPIMTLAFLVLAYAATAALHASGFLAVYVAGLLLGNAALPHRRATIGFVEGVAWLAQIGLFVMLGLLVSPSTLPAAVPAALAIGLVLLLVARPLSVIASAVWLRMPWREQAFLSWGGLRGAVPIVLATIPIVAGLPRSDELLSVVFVLVVVFTLVQGTTMPRVARLLKVARTDAPRELQVEVAPLEEMAADILNVSVDRDSKLHGVYVGELRLPTAANVSLIVRGGASFVPERNTRIVHGDELLVVADSRVRAETERRLRAVSRAGRLAGWFGEDGRSR